MSVGTIGYLLAACLICAAAGCTTVQKSGQQKPLQIERQGSFAAGGTVITTPGTFNPIRQGVYNPNDVDPSGQTLHGDHAAVLYQVPVNRRKYPLVFCITTSKGVILAGDKQL